MTIVKISSFSAFDSIKEGKIIIIISHDLETITNSDNIYVLKDKK